MKQRVMFLPKFCCGGINYTAIASMTTSDKDPSQNLDLCPI
ncbi:hypothetical protein [Anabaena sp. CCY 9402-a]